MSGLALDDLRALACEEAEGDAGVADRSKIDLLVGRRVDVKLCRYFAARAEEVSKEARARALRRRRNPRCDVIVRAAVARDANE
ncbi:MAG: hypothetical protein KF764_28845 [Labilithrix sp.]|nr:hypothetical protein [Labilithrix sp.]